MYVLCGPTNLEMPQKLFLFLKVEVIQFCQPSNAKNVHKSGINFGTSILKDFLFIAWLRQFCFSFLSVL